MILDDVSVADRDERIVVLEVGAEPAVSWHSLLREFGNARDRKAVHSQGIGRRLQGELADLLLVIWRVLLDEERRMSHESVKRASPDMLSPGNRAGRILTLIEQKKHFVCDPATTLALINIGETITCLGTAISNSSFYHLGDQY